MKKIRVLIITDGDNKVGLGHFYRSLSLGDELKKNKMQISYMTSKNKFLKNNLSKIGHHYSYSNNEEKDIDKIKNINPDIIFIDILTKFFPYSSGFIKKLQKCCMLLASMDFEGSGLKYVDLGFHSLFKPKKFSAKKSFVGFEYTILRKEFISARQKYNFSKNIKSILILQGGADSHCISPKIIKSLKKIPKEIKISLILGSMFNCNKELDETLQKLDRKIKLIKNSKKISLEMKKHDLAITAAGNTMMELMMIGIPSLIVCGERHELEIAKIANSKKMALNVGYGKEITQKTIEKSFTKLYENSKLRENYHRNSKRIINGNGSRRICKILQQHIKKYDFNHS